MEQLLVIGKYHPQRKELERKLEAYRLNRRRGENPILKKKQKEEHEREKRDND